MRTQHLPRSLHRRRQLRTYLTTASVLSRVLRSHIQNLSESIQKLLSFDNNDVKTAAVLTTKITKSQKIQNMSSETPTQQSPSQTTPPSNPTDRNLQQVPLLSKLNAVSNEIVTKASLDARTRFLFQSITAAKSNMSCHLRVEDLCKHLRQYPQSKGLAAKIGGVRQLLLVQGSSRDPVVLEGVREALALLGHCEPPNGWGVRILSIDGGGLRGILALEVLRRLEELTGRPVYQMFDYICGVSTGAILTVLLGALKSSITDCEGLYKQIGTGIFKQNPIWGTGKLVLSHAFYDTANWTKLIRENIGMSKLMDTRRDHECPKIAAVSTVVNHVQLQAFTFRNYDYPARVQSQYLGTHGAHLWESIRASAAAPGYFEEYRLGADVHQDGGILVNNPTALAIHECKHLWPKEQLQCVISLGGGRYEPQQSVPTMDPSSTGLKMKLMKIVDSATDTEAVHTILHDLLPPTVYFRINPYITENIPMNESRIEKIEQLQQDARMYLRRNEEKMKLAAKMLTEPRTRFQNIRDFVSLKSTKFFG